MHFASYGLVILLSYLLGSIPAAVWVGKWFYGIDVREHGSGNAGATNVLRILGLKAGIPVLLFDAFKGFAAVQLADGIPGLSESHEKYILWQIILGVLAVAGHIFPVFARFKGGKGVATLLGISLAIAFYPALTAIGVFAGVLAVSRIVSLSSICAGLSFPVSCIFIFAPSSLTLSIFSVIAAAALVITHRKNIHRLLNGQEPRIGQKKMPVSKN